MSYTLDDFIIARLRNLTACNVSSGFIIFMTGHTHIVEYLIGMTNSISRSERIDALELLGATYVDKKKDMIGALELWKRAMEERSAFPNPTTCSITSPYTVKIVFRKRDRIHSVLELKPLSSISKKYANRRLNVTL